MADKANGAQRCGTCGGSDVDRVGPRPGGVYCGHCGWTEERPPPDYEQLQAKLEAAERSIAEIREAVRFAPNSAHWSDILAGHLGDDCLAGMRTVGQWLAEESTKRHAAEQRVREVEALLATWKMRAARKIEMGLRLEGSIDMGRAEELERALQGTGSGSAGE